MVMEVSKELGSNLVQESKAYGYTLSIWGTGSILFHNFGPPTPLLTFAFVFGAVLGFAILSWIAYRGVFVQINNDRSTNVVVGSMVHFIAALGTLALSFFAASIFGEYNAFFIGGLNATISYNLLLISEEYLSEELWHLDQKIHEKTAGL